MKPKGLVVILAVLAAASLAAAQERVTYVDRVPDAVTRAPAPVKVLNRTTAARVLRQVVPQYSDPKQDGLVVWAEYVPGATPEQLREKPKYADPERIGVTVLRPYSDGTRIEFTAKGREVLLNPGRFGAIRPPRVPAFFLPYQKELREVTGITSVPGGMLVTFTWALRPHPVAAALAKGSKLHVGEAVFRLWDDGWRIAKVEGQSLVALRQ
jgi:hypothetical protein